MEFIFCVLIFTGDEMFSDIYKIKLIDDVLYEVYGKVRINNFFLYLLTCCNAILRLKYVFIL